MADPEHGLRMEGQVFDSSGRQIDPSYNVLKLVEAAVKRLDDLNSAHVNRINDLMDLSFRRLDELRNAEARRIDEHMRIRDEYRDKLAEAESKRIDAIRAVDVNAVSVASDRATQSAAVLANQVAASAETLRALVAQTAATIAQQLAQLTAQLTDRISLLEKSSYESSGRSVVANPAQDAKFESLARMMEAQSREIASLRETRSTTEGRGVGMSQIIGYIALVAGLLLAAMTYMARTAP